MSASPSAPELPLPDKDDEDLQRGAGAANGTSQKIKSSKQIDGTKEAALKANAELEAMVEPPDAQATDLISEPDIDSETPISDALTEPLEEETGDVNNETPDEPAETEVPPETDEDGLPDDPLTRKAVEEIVAEEGDAILAAEDMEREFTAVPITAKAESKIGMWLKALWANPRSRWAIIGGFTAIVLAVTLIPPSRYFVLNTAGVRASLNVRVIDGGTLQPLKNVTVRAGGSAAQTDSDGVAKLEEVRLGRTTLQIEKRAFAPVDRAITVGWGSNPMGEFRATAVGTQYTFYVKDFLSGKPIEKAEAASGEGNASSDKDGKIVLTLDTADQDDAAQIGVEITANAYRNEALNLTVNNKEVQSVEMVPSRKHVFVSKRSGTYDVYTVYADGKDEQKIVGGTGLERDDITLVPHQKDSVAALISTRERVLNANGYLLSTLYVVDTGSGELVKIDQSEQIQVIGWSDEGHLIYVKIAAGASGTDPKRHRLMSFNNNDFSATKELASSNSFNDVVMAGNHIYFAPSNIFQENAAAGLYIIDPDGANQKLLLDKEVFTIVRSSYDTLDISIGDSWYDYKLGSADGAKASLAPPASQEGRVYTDNPSNDFSLWVDNRDGKGVLLDYDSSTKNDNPLVSKGGLKLPVYWLNDKYAVFRVRDSRETADYVINTDGGEARKIVDVTDTNGLGRWFYY